MSQEGLLTIDAAEIAIARKSEHPSARMSERQEAVWANAKASPTTPRRRADLAENFQTAVFHPGPAVRNRVSRVQHRAMKLLVEEPLNVNLSSSTYGQRIVFI